MKTKTSTRGRTAKTKASATEGMTAATPRLGDVARDAARQYGEGADVIVTGRLLAENADGQWTAEARLPNGNATSFRGHSAREALTKLRGAR